jgi:hypothetical protein
MLHNEQQAGAAKRAGPSSTSLFNLQGPITDDYDWVVVR